MQTNRDLIEQIRQHRPWHHNIRLTEDIEIASAFDEHERQRENNQNVSLIDPRDRFMEKVGLIYPGGFQGKRFLDCACNGGGYCFWAREMGASACFGFDVRKHWIEQARLVQRYRKIAPVDQISFEVCDLMKLPSKNLDPADLTLFKGIFYHLADPILGIKIAGDLTREVLWINTARCFQNNDDSLYCTFEGGANPMSGVHSLSWKPTGPMVMARILFWLGFADIRHVFSQEDPNNPGFGRMEIIAARTAGFLDHFATREECETIDPTVFKNAKVASDDMKAMF